MSAIRRNPGRSLAASAVALVALAGAIALIAFPETVTAGIQITLTGSVAQNCTVDVSADANASSLVLTGVGAQRVLVGTVLQNCNKKAGYTIAVTSATCSTAPAGAKLTGSPGGDVLAYSVESNNPTTGGSSATVTGLLASVCDTQIARSVTGAKISAETSTVYVNYTGNPGLGADTYSDTLTFTMAVN